MRKFRFTALCALLTLAVLPASADDAADPHLLAAKQAARWVRLLVSAAMTLNTSSNILSGCRNKL